MLCVCSQICTHTLIFSHAYLHTHTTIRLYCTHTVCTLLCLLCAPIYRKPLCQYTCVVQNNPNSDPNCSHSYLALYAVLSRLYKV